MQNLTMILGSIASTVTAAPIIAVHPTPHNASNIDMNNSVWISNFQVNPTIYGSNIDQYWTPGEVLLTNSQYTVKNAGAISTFDVFDVFVNPIDKHYQIMFNSEPFDKNTFTKNAIKVDLANSIIANFESEKITHREIKNSIIVHDGNRLTITNHGNLNFHSSWGRYNSSTGTMRANSIIPFSEIQQVFSEAERGKDYEGAAVYSNYTLHSANYLPLVEVANPPITRNSFALNPTSINSHLWPRGLVFHPDLPNGAGAGSQWWHGLTSSLIPIGAIISAPASAGTSLGMIAIFGGLSYNAGEQKHILSPQQENLMQRLQSHSIDGHHFIPVNNGINANFSGNLTGSANATRWFGDRSEMNVKDLYVSYNITAEATIYDK